MYSVQQFVAEVNDLGTNVTSFVLFLHNSCDSEFAKYRLRLFQMQVTGLRHRQSKLKPLVDPSETQDYYLATSDLSRIKDKVDMAVKRLKRETTKGAVSW